MVCMEGREGVRRDNGLSRLGSANIELNMKANRYQTSNEQEYDRFQLDNNSEIRAHHATTSAALKLLLRRRTLLNPGLSDLDPGTTTALALFVIHASEAAPAILSVAAEATSLSECVALCVRLAGISVGNRDGVGEGGARGRRVPGVGALAVVAVFRAVVPAASLGILLGP